MLVSHWYKNGRFLGSSSASLNARIESVIVAVNRRVCRFSGILLNITSKSSVKVSESSRSASSITRYLILLKSAAPELLCIWSLRRPGVAITTCGRRDNSRACCIMSSPPTTTVSLMFTPLPRTLNCSAIWNASSLKYIISNELYSQLPAISSAYWPCGRKNKSKDTIRIFRELL